MKFFLVWECYEEDFTLIQKGHYFLDVENPDSIDIEVGKYIEEMAKGREMNPLYIAITTCQPMPF